MVGILCENNEVELTDIDTYRYSKQAASRIIKS